MAYILLLAAVIALGGFWYVRARSTTAEVGHGPLPRAAQSGSGERSGHRPAARAGKAGRRNDRRPVKGRWHAISIACGDQGCAAARTLSGQRFLAQEAPVTPLVACDAPACHCRYRHYPDRRAPDDDRRNPASLCSQLHDATGAPERRKRRGRRAGDVR